MSIRFSEAELDTLQRSVAEAELGTSGEIVVFAVPRSSSYEAVLWRGGAIGLVASIALWALLVTLWPAWGLAWLWSAVFNVALFAAGAIVGTVLTKTHGGFFRFLAGQSLLAATVKRRAMRAFLEEGVMETAARTGILLFVSVLERRIEVLADKGIDAVVEQERWADVVDLIRSGLKRKDLIAGLSDGISACGDLLRASGITAADSDRNELRDDIRFETD
jgi:putative membrane protein